MVSTISARVTFIPCRVYGQAVTPAVSLQQHQLCDFHKCECQGYYSPVPCTLKDSNTSCASVKVTSLQCMVSRKTATPAARVSGLLLSSVWYLERQQHQLCDISNTSCVTFTSVSDCQGYYSPASGIWNFTFLSCAELLRLSIQYLGSQLKQVCPCHSS